MVCGFCNQWNPSGAALCAFCYNRLDSTSDETSSGERRSLVPRPVPGQSEVKAPRPPSEAQAGPSRVSAPPPDLPAELQEKAVTFHVPLWLIGLGLGLALLFCILWRACIVV